MTPAGVPMSYPFSVTLPEWQTVHLAAMIGRTSLAKSIDSLRSSFAGSIGAGSSARRAKSRRNMSSPWEALGTADPGFAGSLAEGQVHLRVLSYRVGLVG